MQTKLNWNTGQHTDLKIIGSGKGAKTLTNKPAPQPTSTTEKPNLIQNVQGKLLTQIVRKHQ